MEQTLRDPSRRTALIGAILVFPIVYFMSANVLEHELGIGFLYAPIGAIAGSPVFDMVSKVLFVGGPMVALLLNLLHVVRLSTVTEAGSVTASVTVLRRPWNLAVAGLCLFMLFAVSAYLVAENWRCMVGLMERC
jgi:hypothetical protein